MIVFDGEMPSPDELRNRIEDEVNFGYETLWASLSDQLLAEQDSQKIDPLFEAIEELDAAGEMAQGGNWTIHHVIFDSAEKDIPGGELRSKHRLESALDRPELLTADIRPCDGYWHAPTHGSISVTTSSISGTLSWANASREFTQMHGFEFEAAFVGKTGWGGGYSSFSATWGCYYPDYDSNAEGAGQYAAGCGMPQYLTDNKTYSYGFRLKDSSKTPDTKLSLKSQRLRTNIPYYQCCAYSSVCNVWYNADGTCQTASLSTWKNSYSW